MHARTWATPPGCVVASTSRSACTESTASTSGSVARAAARTAWRSRPGANPIESTGTPRRRARAATWARDSSPGHEQPRGAPARHRREPLEQQGGLADARRPREQDDRPRDQPAAQHPIEIGKPVSRPGRIDGPRLEQRDDRVARPPSPARGRPLFLRELAPGTARRTAAGPLRRAMAAGLARNRTLVLATDRPYAGPSDRAGWLIRATVSEARVRVALGPGEAVRLSPGLKGVNAAVALARGPELPIHSG